jgi:DinB superfamily
VTELETQIADHRAAVNEFIVEARAVDAARWQAPRSKGAWSPAQVTEHLVLFYAYSRRIAQDGEPSPIPWPIRRLVQRLARRVIADSTLKAGRFTRKGRAPGVFQPSATPPPAPQLLAQLDENVRGLEAAIRSRHPEARHTIAHPIFGTLPTTDWVRLQAIHARHHRAQLAV